MTVITSGPPSTPDDDEAVCTAVVEAVSDTADTPALELPPLNEAVDPDALDTLFFGRQTSGQVTFRYAGHVVTVHADQTIEVSRGT